LHGDEQGIACPEEVDHLDAVATNQHAIAMAVEDGLRDAADGRFVVDHENEFFMTPDSSAAK